MQVHVEDLLLRTNKSLLLSINRITLSYNTFAFAIMIIENIVLARGKICCHLKTEDMLSEYSRILESAEFASL